jgi:hypothetical protein
MPGYFLTNLKGLSDTKLLFKPKDQEDKGKENDDELKDYGNIDQNDN